jgi:hypothetical protein
MKRLTPEREEEIRTRGYKWEQICSCGTDVPELLDEVTALRETLAEQNKWVRAQAELLKYSTKECDRLRSLIAEEFGEEYD